MISKKHKCIFIHIPKTAGTSIEKKLEHLKELTHNIQDHRILSELEAIGDIEFNVRKVAYVIKNGNLKRFTPNLKNIIKPEISSRQFNNYFKFAVVRNSWSRMFSYYQMTLRNSNYTDNVQDSVNYLSFSNYLTEIVDSEFMSQLRYIKNRQGKVELDYIIHFHEVQKGFDYVGKKIGLEDTELPKLLMWKPIDYRLYYDDQTIDLVHKLFKEEIEYFNFEYGE